MKTSSKRFVLTIVDAIFQPGRIIFPCGGDVLHCSRETKKGGASQRGQLRPAETSHALAFLGNTRLPREHTAGAAASCRGEPKRASEKRIFSAAFQPLHEKGT